MGKIKQYIWSDNQPRYVWMMSEGRMFRDGVEFDLYTNIANKLWLRPKKKYSNWWVHDQGPRKEQKKLFK